MGWEHDLACATLALYVAAHAAVQLVVGAILVTALEIARAIR